MLTRISLIVVILAGLAVGALNFTQVKEKITTLQTHLKEQTTRAEKAEKERDDTKRTLKKTETELTQTKETLKATTQERDTAVNEANQQKTRADKLTEDLAKARTERDDFQGKLAAYTSTGMTAPEVLNAAKTIKGLQDNLAVVQEENKILDQNVKKIKNELAHYQQNPPPVYLPARLQGKVVASDPKWQFVVLNIGEDQGVLPYGELLVNRQGKLVAKVKVSSVEKDRSVANVLPGWQLGDILEGDQVIPAYPQS